MLWMTRVIEKEAGNQDSIEDLAKEVYPLMKAIAESVYSPVGLLDSRLDAVFVYDKGTMDITLNGTTFIRIWTLTSQNLPL